MTMPKAMKRKIFARSLLLQSCWNTERMQNLGVCLAIEPWLSRCYGRSGRLKALARHLGFFNTNPYMAPFAVGMVCALEEEAARAPVEQETRWKRINGLKTALSGPLAGIGDAFFWGALRPACAAAAGLAALALWRLGWHRAPLAMPVLYVMAFDIPAVYARWTGLRLGYEWKDQIALKLKGIPWQRWIKGARLGGAVCGWALTAVAVAATPGPRRAVGLMAFAFYAVCARFVGPTATPARFYAACCAAAGAAAAAGWL